MLLKQLGSVFSAVPPVYARPPETSSPTAGPSSRVQAGSPGQNARIPAGASTAEVRCKVSQHSLGLTKQTQQQPPPPPPARPGFGLPPIQTDVCTSVLPEYPSDSRPYPNTDLRRPLQAILRRSSRIPASPPCHTPNHLSPLRPPAHLAHRNHRRCRPDRIRDRRARTLSRLCRPPTALRYLNGHTSLPLTCTMYIMIHRSRKPLRRRSNSP